MKIEQFVAMFLLNACVKPADLEHIVTLLIHMKLQYKNPLLTFLN